jgi:hypothetical protein
LVRIDKWNTDPKPLIWYKTREEIVNTIARCCGDIIEAPNTPSMHPSRGPLV